MELSDSQSQNNSTSSKPSFDEVATYLFSSDYFFYLLLIAATSITCTLIYIVCSSKRPPKTEEYRALASIQNLVYCKAHSEDIQQFKQWLTYPKRRKLKIEVETICCRRNVVRLPCSHSFCQCKLRYMLTNRANIRLPGGEFRCYCLDIIPLSMAKQALPASYVKRLVNSHLISLKLDLDLGIKTPSFRCELCEQYLPIDQGLKIECENCGGLGPKTGLKPRNTV